MSENDSESKKSSSYSFLALFALLIVFVTFAVQYFVTTFVLSLLLFMFYSTCMNGKVVRSNPAFLCKFSLNFSAQLRTQNRSTMSIEVHFNDFK